MATVHIFRVGEYVWVQYKSLVLFKMHYNAESKSNTSNRLVRRWGPHIPTHSSSFVWIVIAGKRRWRRTPPQSSWLVRLFREKKKRFFFCSSAVLGVFGHFRVTNDERMPNGVRMKDSTTNAPRTINCRRKTDFFCSFQLPTSKQGTVYDKCDAMVCVRPICRQRRAHWLKQAYDSHKSHTHAHHRRCDEHMHCYFIRETSIWYWKIESLTHTNSEHTHTHVELEAIVR